MKHLGFASIPAVQQYLRYAEHKNIETSKAVAIAGIAPNVLKNENGRIKGEQFQALIKALIEQTNDPLMGLNSSQHVQPGSYSVLGYILMSCATIGEALQRISRFERLVGDMGITTTKVQGELIYIQWHCAYSDIDVRQQMIDNVLASWTNYARWLANQPTSPNKVLLERPSPSPKEIQKYETFFNCPIEFGAEQNAIILHQDLLKEPLRQPDKLLLKTLESHAESQISALNETDLSFSIQVSNTIRTQLNLGVARKELVAEELNMTARTLQRKLATDGNSYQSLLDQIRLERASDMLRNSALTIQDIAFNLGFSDGRSFHRSFKNWTGKTPGDYRNKH
jgi:AraC-like DNA-binding protein